MITYRIKFEIDVESDNPDEACKHAWELITSEESWLPIGEITDMQTGAIYRVDLEDVSKSRIEKVKL